MATSNNSKFLVIDGDDMAQVESLSKMYPKLTKLIQSSDNKDFVINFKDGERSLIVMVVNKNKVPIAS